MGKTPVLSVPMQAILSREGKWFVASCPLLGIATQGRTEKEVRENMEDLVKDYLEDPDTPKPRINKIVSSSITVFNVPVKIPAGDFDKRRTQAVTTA